MLLHKPAGTVTTASDPQGRRTVVELVDHPARVVPVGRLDADTTGALLLTNDGELAHRLAHPRYEVEKVYEAEVEGDPTEDALEPLREGIQLDDGPTSPAQARRLGPGRVELSIHEGRKHQVKRMLAAVGHPGHPVASQPLCGADARRARARRSGASSSPPKWISSGRGGQSLRLSDQVVSGPRPCLDLVLAQLDAVELAPS